jgi:TPR repeat protein
MFSLGQVALMERRAQEAVTWFRRAADHGHVRSLYWIAKLLWRGDGGNKDRAEAQRLLQRAAEKGDREARRALRFLSWLRKRGAREP